MARRLQNRLALAQFKTKRGWEDLAFETIEPRFEEEVRRKRISDGDMLSDSSSSASDLPSYPTTRGLMSSPLKAPFFSDAIGSSNGSTGHRKRTYMTSFDMPSSSPNKRFRSSPTTHKSFPSGRAPWKDNHQLAQSSPIKPRRQQHFTTSTGPDVSFFPGSRRITEELTTPNLAAHSDSDDSDLLPAHSFHANNVRSSPPSTPPMRHRPGPARRDNKDKPASSNAVDKSGGEEGAADLLLYLAASPSPANPPANKTRMEPPSTPPPKSTSSLLAATLPSSMMTTTPGGGNLFPNTPGQQAFDFSDFVNITPSPAQKPWKTPIPLGLAKTPLSVARRRLTFDDLP